MEAATVLTATLQPAIEPVLLVGWRCCPPACPLLLLLPHFVLAVAVTAGVAVGWVEWRSGLAPLLPMGGPPTLQDGGQVQLWQQQPLRLGDPTPRLDPLPAHR
jgi:hypothetical protein